MQREPISEDVNQVAKQIVDAAFAVHSALGAGLLETVYEVCLEYELTNNQRRYQTYCPIILCVLVPLC